MISSHLQRGRDAAVTISEQIVAAVQVDSERPAVVTPPRLRRHDAMDAAHRMHSDAEAVIVDAVEGERGAQQPREALDVVVGPAAWGVRWAGETPQASVTRAAPHGRTAGLSLGSSSLECPPRKARGTERGHRQRGAFDLLCQLMPRLQSAESKPLEV